MPEPVTATVAAVISAGAAVVGTAQGAYTAASGSSGFHVGHSTITYPVEVPMNLYASERQSVGWDIIKFTADGTLWSNYLAVSATGYLSNTTEPVKGYPGTAYAHVPMNRFIHLEFGQSGNSENMSGGLLEVNISPWGGAREIAENGPDHPFVAMRVAGRFDPRGFGDYQFEFKLSINTFGGLLLDMVTANGAGGDFSVMNMGDHINVYLDQNSVY